MNNSLIESTLAGVCDALTLPGSTIHETSRKGQRNSVFMASKVFELEKRDSPRTCTDGTFGFYDSLWKPFRLDFQAGLSMEELLVWWRCPESRRNAKAIKWTFAMSRQTSWETYFYALFFVCVRSPVQTNKQQACASIKTSKRFVYAHFRHVMMSIVSDTWTKICWKLLVKCFSWFEGRHYVYLIQPSECKHLLSTP